MFTVLFYMFYDKFLNDLLIDSVLANHPVSSVCEWVANQIQDQKIGDWITIQTQKIYP